jgi:hypothetical protein
MIDLGGVAGLHEHGHELRSHCPRCDRRVAPADSFEVPTVRPRGPVQVRLKMLQGSSTG